MSEVSVTPKTFIGIEAGGTKFVCGVGDLSGSYSSQQFRTEEPEGTLGAVHEFVRTAIQDHGGVDAIGVASFGPIDLDAGSARFGEITSTPKKGWRGVNIAKSLAHAFNVPVAVDTDVNAAALAEAKAFGTEDLAYVTVGTGIGVGFVLSGRTRRGFGHPEAGHVSVKRHRDHGDFAGICPFHGDCLEGLASGPALASAWGKAAGKLHPSHTAWDVEADYLGQLATNLILTSCPSVIVFGGGVMQQRHLLPMVHEHTLKHLAGYASHWSAEAVRQRIVLASTNEPPGLLGAYLLADQQLTKFKEANKQ